MSSSAVAVDAERVARLAELRRVVEGALEGKPHVVELATVAFLARGHILIEDVPGVGKTTLARALARAVGAKMNRVQFTSDLLPSDLIGVSIATALVTGSGSLTVTISGMPAGSYVGIFVGEFSTDGSWDATREEDTNTTDATSGTPATCESRVPSWYTTASGNCTRKAASAASAAVVPVPNEIVVERLAIIAQRPLDAEPGH